MNAGDRLDTLAGSWAEEPPTAFAFDFETNGLNPYTAHIVGISIAYRQDSTGDLVAAYFPIRHEQPTNPILGYSSGPGEWELHPENIDWADVIGVLGKYFADPAILKIAHNAKYDFTVGNRAGLEIENLYDTLLAAWSFGGHMRYGLKGLVETIFGHKMVEFDDLTVYKVGRKQMRRSFAQVEFSRALQYGIEDAYWTFRLYEHQQAQFVERPDVARLFAMENRLMRIVAQMEANGIAVDQTYLAEFKEALDARIAQLEAQLSVFGVSAYSPQSVAGWYVGNGCKLEHYGSSKGKNGHYGVAADILERIARDFKAKPEFQTVALAVNECRTLSKLRSTYIDSWLGSIAEDGRIHATFDQRGAATGRFSSSGPNLQNVPTFPVLGKHMRKAVIAPPGYKLVSIDYSQIELRMLAHICGDAGLCDAYWHDRDLHTATAAAIFNKDASEVSKSERQVGKTLNFAIGYGGGPGVIRVQTGATMDEAKAFYDAFKRTYPGITRYMGDMVDFATRTGYVETYLGRRVYVGKGEDGRAFSTVAVNSPIQGSAADVIKLAMVKMEPLLQQYSDDLQMIMQVHDELVFYVKESLLAEIVPQLVDCMETVVELNVPLRVDAEVGDNWYEVQAMDGIEHAPFDVDAAQVRMLV